MPETWFQLDLLNRGLSPRMEAPLGLLELLREWQLWTAPQHCYASLGPTRQSTCSCLVAPTRDVLGSKP